jgi:hypothetical protein
MPRPPVQNWGSSPYHLVDDILRSVEALGVCSHDKTKFDVHFVLTFSSSTYIIRHI